MAQAPKTSILLRLPLALFLAACLLTAFQMFMVTASATGVSDIFVKVVTSSLLLLLLAAPFGYQMHIAGNGRGIVLAFLLWVAVGLFNLAGLLTSWPVRVALAGNEQRLLKIHQTLKPDEVRPLAQRFGLVYVKEARRLMNGNTWFVTGGAPGGSNGLLYSPQNDPTGFNEWSCYQVSDKWYVIEED